MTRFREWLELRRSKPYDAILNSYVTPEIEHRFRPSDRRNQAPLGVVASHERSMQAEMAVAANLVTLWSWPWEAAKTTTHLMETAVAMQLVLAERLPMISAAMTNPLTADHRELSLMVSEKVDAFGRSQRSIATTGEAMRKAAESSARDLGRIAGGRVLGPAEWFQMFERNVALGSALVTLPMRALAPVHKGVTANSRRLGRRKAAR